MRPLGTPKQLERRRRQAVAMHQQGHGPTQIARVLKTTPQSVCQWVREHRKGGDQALAASPASGRPPKLNARRRRALVACLLKGASAFGFSTDLWTCPRIARLIEDRYKVHYHVDAIPRVMAALAFSPSEARTPGGRTRRAGHRRLDPTRLASDQTPGQTA